MRALAGNTAYPLASMDSDFENLEAFSCKQTDDSFVVLDFQLGTLAKCLKLNEVPLS